MAHPGKPLRILFLRSAAIGDALVAFGALRAISETRPGSTIDIIGAPELREASVGLAYIGEVFPVQRRKRWTLFAAAAAVLRRQAYDVVVDARSSTDRMFLHTALILAASRAPMRIGKSARDLGLALTHLVRPMAANEHWVDYMFEFFAPALFGARLGDRAPRLELSAEERENGERLWSTAPGASLRVLINIATGHPWRRWSDDRFEAVAAYVRLRWPEARIAIIGHGREKAAAAIALKVGGIQPKTTFREMMAIAATSDLVVTPDTAVSHVAAAFDRTIVSLHPVATESWRPYQARGRQLFSSSSLTLNFISVVQVLRAVDQLLGAGSDGDQGAADVVSPRT
jgi:ADP-heptose:LPS heptosyltransferase